MEMKIRAYVESLFRNAPNSLQSVELREEMIQNLIEKYHDLLVEGKAEEAAYNITVSSIGDISELVGSLGAAPYCDAPPSVPINGTEYQHRTKRSAIIIAVSVCLYICCVIPVILFDGSVLAVCAMFLMIAAATGMLIYNGMTNKRQMSDETMAGEFKQWRQENDSRMSLYKSIKGVITAITLVLYFVISFATGAWYITWLIFIIGAAVENVVKIIVLESGGKQ